MFLLNPTYLWALLGLAVPIAIHLWSRKEGKTVKVGSIHLLRESDPKQSSSIRINEWWLLFLRLLLLALLVVIMAGPQLKDNLGKVGLTYLVEPSLLQDEKMKAVLDTLKEGAGFRLLAPGFPEAEKDFQEVSSSEATAPASSVPPNYWQLAVEMEALATDSIVVFTRGFAAGVKGQRPASGRGVNWIIVPSEQPEKEYVEAVRKKDSIRLLMVNSDAESLDFKTETLPLQSNRFRISAGGDSISLNRKDEKIQLPLRQVDSIQISIFYDNILTEEMRYTRASFNALSNYLDQPMDVSVFREKDSLQDRKTDVLVWLSSEPVAESEKLLLQYKPDSLASELILPGPTINHFYLTENLNSENVIAEHLAEQVFLFLNLHPHLEEKVRSYDNRTLARGIVLPKESVGERGKSIRESKDVSGWLWLVLLFILVAERTLAQYRKQ